MGGIIAVMTGARHEEVRLFQIGGDSFGYHTQRRSFICMTTNGHDILYNTSSCIYAPYSTRGKDYEEGPLLGVEDGSLYIGNHTT